ncbi:glycosyltransferase [Ectothiorhodospira marina]|uniref:Alpha-1,6-mannosyltransferase n=1 Tax=Ectothiorhodospira marina TaxID=1396821 RepID=A0A1H7PXF0_9GAMM|nr:glycosyltransferase [Ectothiorhodospira marina]SEL40148.1 alpha-1,6-mannosyltransferase [Ectothiorhodospira marina]
MRHCDLTLAYTETSGGIRTYIDAKRQHIARHTEHEHVLIIPGERDRIIQDGRLTRIEIQSPLIPGCHPYRFFTRPHRVLRALREAAPDAVELGSFFTCPWAAFRYRADRLQAGHRPLVAAYFHTDIASAYVGAPLRRRLSALPGTWGDKAGQGMESTARRLFGRVFRHCDLTLAATGQQADRLRQYGVGGTHIVPLGVDTLLFNPARRDSSWRAELGLDPEDILLLYCGRLDGEKDVLTLARAFECLNRDGPSDGPRFVMAMMGAGPHREALETRARDLPGLRLLDYESDRPAYARALASADIYVTAGPHETFGLSVVEAQASGLPVVGVEAGALKEHVRPDRGRLGPVGDAEAMAGHIRQVAVQHQTLGAAARHHVLASGYAWEQTLDRLLALYDEALSPRPAPGVAAAGQRRSSAWDGAPP